MRSIDPDIWIKALFNSIESLNDDANDITDNIVISDVRYPNEVKAIHYRNGIVIRIERQLKLIDNNGRDDQHPSEISLDDFDSFDFIYENNGTEQEMFDNVLKFIKDKYDI